MYTIFFFAYVGLFPTLFCLLWLLLSEPTGGLWKLIISFLLFFAFLIMTPLMILRNFPASSLTRRAINFKNSIEIPKIFSGALTRSNGCFLLPIYNRGRLLLVYDLDSIKRVTVKEYRGLLSIFTRGHFMRTTFIYNLSCLIDHSLLKIEQWSEFIKISLFVNLLFEPFRKWNKVLFEQVYQSFMGNLAPEQVLLVQKYKIFDRSIWHSLKKN